MPTSGAEEIQRLSDLMRHQKEKGGGGGVNNVDRRYCVKTEPDRYKRHVDQNRDSDHRKQKGTPELRIGEKVGSENRAFGPAAEDVHPLAENDPHISGGPACFRGSAADHVDHIKTEETGRPHPEAVKNKVQQTGTFDDMIT